MAGEKEMNWDIHLEPGEHVRWEGRPAPRGFTFRNWRHSVFGILLFLLSLFWFTVGIQLGAVYHSPIIPWIPVPFVLGGLYLGIGHVLLARLEWERVFYAVTDRRVLSTRGVFRPRVESLRLEELTHFLLKPLGEEMGSFRLTGGRPPRTLSLPCIEYPRRVAALLEAALAANDRLAQPAAGPAS